MPGDRTRRRSRRRPPHERLRRPANSKAIHAATEDGKAYGFACDDVADFASYIQDTSPTALTLTLTAF